MSLFTSFVILLKQNLPFHPILQFPIVFHYMRWWIVVCLDVFCLLLLASVRAKVQEVRLVEYFGMITTYAEDHFLPFSFADPLVFSPKG